MIPRVEFPMMGSNSVTSRLAFVKEPISIVTAIALIISFLIFIALVFLPWVIRPGIGLSIADIDGWIAAGCFIFVFCYIGANFLHNSRLRAIAHIASALLCLLLWMVFRFGIFPKIAYFAISKSDLEGEGLYTFLVVIIMGIAVGVIEMFPLIDLGLETLADDFPLPGNSKLR
jgi:hypothetical protein